MSASFDPALPCLRDHLRLALGDFDVAAPLLADETIDAKLGAVGYVEALAQLAESLAIRAAQEPSHFDEGGSAMSVEWAERVSAWRELAQAARSGRISAPIVGAARPGVAVGSLANPDRTDMRSD